MEKSSEFRQNLATKEWVILAPARGERPSDIPKRMPIREPKPQYDPHCPFCVGNEAQTEKPTLVLPAKGKWQVRVVPNKFAALNPHYTATRASVGSFLSAKGFGIAEVVVEHPNHNLNPALMKNSEVTNILKAYRQRQFGINKNENINLVTIFRNHGGRAGTSLAHPHSQIIATPIVPPHVRYPMEQAIAHYDMYGQCVYCEMVREERRQKKRIIADKEIKELAIILRKVLFSLYKGMRDPDYNYIIRSSPVGDEDTRYLHWYMVIVPKITIPAGFEIGSGIYINTISPEAAARVLRKHID
jgi:UDPglucose--hexose-1-phosphate uridylyltransferase